MADQQNQELDPVSESWDRNIKLRNDLASRAGKPDNLEIKPLDAPKQLMGSAVSSVGTGIKELSLGDVARAGETVQKGSMLSEGVNWLAGKAADNFLSPEDAAQAKMAATIATGLADGANVNGSSNDTNKAINTVADAADVVIEPVAKAVGGAIKGGGDWVKDSVSDQGKEAMNRQFFTEDKDGLHAGDAWAADPAVWAMKMSDVVGTVGGTLVVGGAVKGGVKAAVMRSMLKRGAPEAYAAQVAELTAQRIGEKAAFSTGAAMSVGQTADQTRESVKSLSFEELMNSDSFKQNVQLVNQDPQYQSLSSSDRLDLARQRTADMAADYAKSDPTTYAAAAAGTVLGDAMLFKMITGKAGAPAVTGNLLSRAGKGFAKGGVGEGVGEAAEEGAQQNIQNRSSNEVAGTNIDPMQGVKQAAAEAGVLGFMSGGGIGSGSAVAHGSSKPAQPSESPEQQVGDTQTISDATQPADLNSTAPVIEDAPDMETAINEVYGDDVQTKVPGSFSIGKDESGYRAAYVDDNGELQVSEPYATPDEAQKIVTGGQVIRQDVSQTIQPTNETQQSNEGAETTQQPEMEPQAAISGLDQALPENNQQLPVDGQQNINASQAELPSVPTQPEQAPTNSNDIFSQLTTLRVTKRGNPFASQKEALLASRKTETPIELPTGGFGVVDKAELEQVQSNISKTQYSREAAPAPDANSIVNDITVGLPDGTKTTIGEQTASQSSSGQVSAPVSDVSDTNVAGINQVADPVDANESTSNQVAAQNQSDINVNEQPVSQAAVKQSVTDIPPQTTDSASVIMPDSTEVADGELTQQNNLPTTTKPDLPWAGYKEKPDGSMVMEGDSVQLKEWAKQNNITAIKSKTGIVVGKNSVPVVKDIIAKSNEPGNATQNEVAPTEASPGQPTEIIAPPQLAEAESRIPAVSVPWTNSIDKPDGTMILEGDPIALKSWAKDNGITAIKSKNGVVVGKSSVPAAKELISMQQAAGDVGVKAVEPIHGDSVSSLTSQPVLKSKSADSSNKSGISKEEVDRVVEEFKREYKGNIPPEIITRQTQEEAYGPEATIDRVGKIEGGYLPAGNKLHIIADNISTKRDGVSGNTSLSSQRALQRPDAIRRVLRHEILGHYGLNTFNAQEKRSLIGKIRGTRNDADLNKIWAYVDKNYSDKSESKKAEEVFAHVAEEKHGIASDAWNRVLSSLHGVMRRNGMLNKDVTIHELREYARSIAKGIKSGERKQQIFPSDNESQYRKTDTETADKGGFSLSTMPKNEAEISGKGMTKPEASMVAREWLRQFKTDINVEVVKDQAEFESALADRGFANSIQSGEMDNAAYLPDSKTILINASAIQNPKRLKQIMRHEILVHHGLRYVVGEDAYAKIISAIAQGYKTSPAIKDAVDTVTKNYADKDMFTQMEEAFAHYAEMRPADSGPIGRLWQRIVGMVKSALQKVNFISVNEAEQQLDSVLHAIAKNMRKGIEDGVMAERSGDAMFSRSSAADDALMTKLGLGPKQDVIDKTKERINTLKQTDRAQVKSWIDETIKKANTQILDALAPIKYAEDAGGKVEASDSGYVAARLASGSATVMNATMLHGLPAWKDGVIQRKDGTGEADSLLGIFESLGSDLHNWLGWMAGHRGEILLAEGRENLLTPEDISALKAKGNGKEAKFEAARQKWNALNKAVLDLAEEAGLFTAEDRAAWDSEWYVPFFRETEDGDVTGPYKHKGIANQTAGIKKLKGGTGNVNDILQNIFTTTSKTIDAAMKNMAAQKVVHNLAETDLIEVITKPNLMDIKAAVKNQNDMMIVKLEGEDYLIRVNDKDLFNAMTMIDQKVERGAVRRLAMKAKHILTAGVTASPDFMLRNFLRDAASTWAINEDGFKPMIDSIRGMKKAWKMDDSSIDMMFSGASFMGGNLRGNDPEAMASAVRKALRRKGMSPEQIDRYEKTIIRNGKQAMDVIGKYWEKYERVGEAVENGSREAAYEAAIKAGKTHAQAAFEAKDLMDFSMMGSSKLMQVFVDVLPFFNARMQGLGKLGRAIKANPKQIAKRGGMIAGASLALLALNWDDERYEDLPDWDKDLNWHFWLGDQHFRIPKPFEIGLMFGTLPERMARTMGGKDTTGKFGKVVARNMLETFAINPIPQVVKPLTEAYFNYDPFRGGPIESMIDMNVNPEARYDERTSLMMRELGELTGMSPKKLEHVISGYTGTMGGYVMAMGDSVVRMMGDYGDSPALRADQIPIIKSVYQGSAPAKSTQAMQDFYQMVDKANQVYATIHQYNKEGRTEDANELLEENRDKLAGRKTLNKAQLQFRSLRNEMSLIQRDRLLNSEQKRDRLDKLLKRRNDLAAQLIQRFE